MTKSTITSWARSKGFANKSNISHVSLARGAFSIPHESLYEFYKVYENAFNQKEDIHLVEVKGEYFKFFVDVDYKSSQPLEDSEQDTIVECIYESVKRIIFDESESACMVCKTKPKQLEDGYKTGIHIIWRNVIVDNMSATLLAKQAVMDLTSAFGPRGSGNSWDDVVDPSVYKNKNTGLRMKFSTKPEDGKRIYRAVYEINASGEKNNVCCGILEQLMSCSIRTGSTEKTRIQREEIEKSIIEREEENQMEQCLVCVDDAQQSTIDDFIRFNFPLHKIKSSRRIMKVENKDMYIVFVESKYCMNLGREHKSNNVYFVVTKDGVSQKCFCRCDTTQGRKYGLCKEFKSTPSPLNASLRKRLFGKQTSNKREPVLSGAWDVAEHFLDSLLVK